MSIIVIGGGGRGAGKTTLVCGLLRAMPEIAWTAVKITTHEHGKAMPVWEETTPGQESDTARYLAAGARRALLVAAGEDAVGTGEVALGPVVEKIIRECPAAGGVIFESNSVLNHVRPDVCLCASTSPWTELKASYDLLMANADAMVELAAHDHIIEAEKITFRLASLDRVSPVMLDWVRERLGNRG
jgi:molybdopterin-guanine dinucleotide biosynthesis protein